MARSGVLVAQCSREWSILLGLRWYPLEFKSRETTQTAIKAGLNFLIARRYGRPAASLGAASCEHGNRYDGKGLSFFKNSSGRNSNIWIYNRLNLIDLSERRSYLSSPIGRSDRKKI